MQAPGLKPGGAAPAAPAALTDAQLRRTVWVSALLALLLPPLTGATLMGVADFYPMPEVYEIFFSYTGPYVLVVLGVVLLLARAFSDHLIRLGQLESPSLQQRARQLFRWLPWTMIGFIVAYSMVGALTADYAVERLGYRSYDLRGHLYNQFGLVPVVLITVFPVFFYFTDRLGRYFGPRGVHDTIIPMGAKLALLGIVTPLLVDSFLVGYYINVTHHFSLETVLIWGGLLLLAAGGTWLAWHSQRQGLQPLQTVLHGQEPALDETVLARLKPQSLDEFGVLTYRLARQLELQRELRADLARSEALAQAMLDQAGTLVLVLDRTGRVVRFNQACERLSGYRAEEMLGRYPWDTVLPPEVAAQVRSQAFEALAAHPHTLSGHHVNEWLSRDGQRYLIEWFNTALLDGQGRMEFMVSVGVDITQQRRTEEALRQSQEMYARAETIAHVGSWDWDIALGRLRWSDEIYRIFGLTPQSFGATYEAFLQAIHPEDRAAVRAAVDAGLADPACPYRIRHRVVRPDGEIRTVQEQGAIYRDAAGQPLRMIGTIHDVTEEVRHTAALRESERKYRQLHESMTDAYAMVDLRGRLLEWNPAFERLLGYPAQELGQRTYEDLTPAAWHAAEARIIAEQVLAGGASEIYEKEYLRQDGSVIPVELRTFLLHDEAGEPSGMWAIVRDISARKAAEQAMTSLAYSDPLTGLPNRALFNDRLRRVLAQARREQRRAAVLFIDLDRFKPVNDRYGHAVGDELLKAVARQLRECVRESDTVSRLGGDEFVVLLSEVAAAADALAVARKIHDRLREPFQVGPHRLEISSSIGVAVFPDHGQDDDALVKRADDAMYQAKQAGSDRLVLAAD